MGVSYLSSFVYVFSLSWFWYFLSRPWSLFLTRCFGICAGIGEVPLVLSCLFRSCLFCPVFFALCIVFLGGVLCCVVFYYLGEPLKNHASILSLVYCIFPGTKQVEKTKGKEEGKKMKIKDTTRQKHDKTRQDNDKTRQDKTR
jgi:hypothetical protein